MDQATGHFRGFKIFVGPSWKGYTFVVGVAGHASTTPSKLWFRGYGSPSHPDNSVVSVRVTTVVIIVGKEQCNVYAAAPYVVPDPLQFAGKALLQFRCLPQDQRGTQVGERDVYALLKFTNVVVRTLVRSCSKGSLKTAGRSQGWEPKHTESESASLLCRPDQHSEKTIGRVEGRVNRTIRSRILFDSICFVSVFHTQRVSSAHFSILLIRKSPFWMRGERKGVVVNILSNHAQFIVGRP